MHKQNQSEQGTLRTLASEQKRWSTCSTLVERKGTCAQTKPIETRHAAYGSKRAEEMEHMQHSSRVKIKQRTYQINSNGLSKRYTYMKHRHRIPPVPNRQRRAPETEGTEKATNGVYHIHYSM